MSENCENKNPLQRDGTSQQQRLLKALLPSYVSVDERSLEDLRVFAERYAELIRFYDQDNIPNGDWTTFFVNKIIDETGQRTEPHYALFIAFLKILEFAKNDINTITQRHLDFYCRDVLRIKEKSAIPDQVFVIFELAQQVVSYLVDKDSELNGGPDKTGVQLVYDTEKQLVVSKAQATEFKALFYNKANDSRLYASPVANSANGLGEPIETEEPKWRTFGAIADPAAPFNSPLADRPQAGIGFAFASPVLFLGEGNRNVKITLQLANTTGITNADLKNAFNVLFSGEKEWIAPAISPAKLPQDVTYLGAAATKTIIIQRTITVDQPAIVPYNKDVLMDPINTAWPVVKIMLNTDNNVSPYVYEKLKALVVNNVSIVVDVEGVKELILQNDQSKLNASKPFLPFGSRPVVSSSFYIGSNEVFRKRLSSVDLNITWKGLPQNSNGFLGYYQHYIPANVNARRTNAQFKAEISILDGRTWHQVISDTSDAGRLFNPGNNSLLSDFRQINIANSSLNNIPAYADMPSVTRYENSTQKGFLKLELANVDFGHQDYQISYATQAIKAATSGGNLTLYPLPNEPYTPTVSTISLDYVATAGLSLVNNASVNNANTFKNRTEQFFHIHPFGAAEVHPYIVKTSPFVSLLPVFNDEGSLYIGINGLVPPQTLSVLLKVAEGSANPDLPRQVVKWSYLNNNEWFEFPKFNIISDSSNGLLTSGIIQFDVPKAINTGNTILPDSLYWIKASVTTMSRAICDMIAIKTQAITAIFQDNGNDPAHLRESLPADTIKALVNSPSGIKKVLQPYASFGGKVKEESDDYYTRVSERLRHKNRAVNIFDYERIVLEEFPSVYKIKCINHTRYISANDINEMVPGHVSLVAVSDLRNKNAVNPLQPKTSLLVLSQITDLVSQVNPPCVELHVKNPIYEEIRVRFNVRFHPGYDIGFYGQQLNQEIKQFLSPWAYGQTDIVFGQRIHASVILNFIEERGYVDYVTCFAMDQILADKVLTNVEEAIPQTGASILTSVVTHDIEVLETDDCECDDNIVTTRRGKDEDCTCDHEPGGENNGFGVPGSYIGVGGSTVGGNFIVGNGLPFGNDGIDNMQIGNDFEVE